MPADHRRAELTEAEVELKVAERAAKEKKAWHTSVGGIVGGIAGVTFAFVALLRFESATLSVVGFLVMGVSLGMVSPEQVMSRLPSFKK